ncbi:MAG: hypothetical protein GXP58_11830 [Deltaproteobacteria bacterium]|nr:hypothetical protein [Deltaproteobacteria bacterium]
MSPPFPVIGRRALFLYMLFFLLATQGCTLLRPLPAGVLGESATLSKVRITFRFQPTDRPALPLIKKTIQAALPRIRKWGRITHPVTVIICPDHDALERAVHRHGYRWLKAWATEKTVYIQSPRSWLLFSRKRFSELMTHELTHVVHYQTAGIAASRTTRNDPLWFREGLASWTAGQGYRRYSRRNLLRKLRAHPGFHPLRPTSREIKGRQKLVYSAAHQMVTYLIEEYGEEKIREVLHRISEGCSFHQAFRATYGLTEETMMKGWKRWLDKSPCNDRRI